MAKARMVIEKVLTNIENVLTYFEKVQSLIAKGWRVVEKVLTNFENVLTFIANVRRLFADYLMYNAESGIKFDNIRLSLPNAVNEEQERGCLALMITLFL